MRYVSRGSCARGHLATELQPPDFYPAYILSTLRGSPASALQRNSELDY